VATSAQAEAAKNAWLFDARRRQDVFSLVDGAIYDLIVIGGGINGAGVAHDAALRGLRVLLVEQRDLAFGTSSRSSKLIHGGLRYLEHYQFKLVFEGTNERAALRKVAPHLVRPLMEPLFVEVSNDNVSYCGFAPDYANAPETTYSNDAAHWLRFAGKSPVVYNIANAATNFNAAELFTDATADGEGDIGGGDLFDLDNLSDSNVHTIGCNTTLRDELRTNGFRYLRLVSAARRINPDTGAAYVADAISSGPDIDGVVARSVE
jgi:glycine/D-amino acid oxidase-like deaminating enzyme